MASLAVALVAAIVETQEPIAIRAIFCSVVIDDECRRILGPLVANERFEDVSVPCFLTGNDAPNPILGLDVPACLIEEVAVVIGIPGGVAIVKFYFVERIVVEIEQGALQEPLRNTFDNQTLAVSNFLAIYHVRLHALETVFKPLGSLSPGKIEGNLNLLNRTGWHCQCPADKGCQADQASCSRPLINHAKASDQTQAPCEAQNGPRDSGPQWVKTLLALS